MLVVNWRTIGSRDFLARPVDNGNGMWLDNDMTNYAIRIESEDTDEQWSARIAGQAMLQAVETYETFSGDTFDPNHPNARDELRRVGASGWGKGGWKHLDKDERKLIDAVIDRLLIARLIDAAPAA